MCSNSQISFLKFVLSFLLQRKVFFTTKFCQKAGDLWMTSQRTSSQTSSHAWKRKSGIVFRFLTIIKLKRMKNWCRTIRNIIKGISRSSNSCLTASLRNFSKVRFLLSWLIKEIHFQKESWWTHEIRRKIHLWIFRKERESSIKMRLMGMMSLLTQTVRTNRWILVTSWEMGKSQLRK